jgi:hypothetical protein
LKVAADLDTAKKAGAGHLSDAVEDTSPARFDGPAQRRSGPPYGTGKRSNMSTSIVCPDCSNASAA